jgi:hypothetical protein
MKGRAATTRTRLTARLVGEAISRTAFMPELGGRNEAIPLGRGGHYVDRATGNSCPGQAARTGTAPTLSQAVRRPPSDLDFSLTFAPSSWSWSCC